jgi:hypothetical protein
MLAWLHAAFSHEAEVESYRETTEGVLSPLPEGRFWVSEVILNGAQLLRLVFAVNERCI